MSHWPWTPLKIDFLPIVSLDFPQLLPIARSRSSKLFKQGLRIGIERAEVPRICVWGRTCSGRAGESWLSGVCLFSWSVKIPTNKAYHQSAEEAISATCWEYHNVLKGQVGIRNMICIKNDSSSGCAKYGPGEGMAFSIPLVTCQVSTHLWL